MWRPRANPPLGGWATDRVGGGHVLSVMEDWPRSASHGRVCRTPLIGKGVAACHMSVEQGSDAAIARGIGADEGDGEAAQKHPSNHPTSQQRYRNMF